MSSNASPSSSSRLPTNTQISADDELEDVFGVPLPTNILSKIFGYIGREGTFAFQIACGDQCIGSKPYIQENALVEPFTYWDWAGITQQGWGLQDNSCIAGGDICSRSNARDKEDSRRKRRVLWERQRGFRLDSGPWLNASSGRERWIGFQSIIHDANRYYVKKIAISHWMTLDDLRWISDQLPALEALDLSDVHGSTQSSLIERGKSRTKQQNQHIELTHWLSISDSLRRVLERVTWIGLQQEDRIRSFWVPDNDPFAVLLPLCKNLKTLSIRGRNGYQADELPNGINLMDSKTLHRTYCEQILAITKNVPDTVTTIELRRSVLLLEDFISTLEQKKPNISKVGIDLGAWVQIYPLRSTPTSHQGSIHLDYDCEERNLAISRTLREDAEFAVHIAEKDAYKDIHVQILGNNMGPLSVNAESPSAVDGFRLINLEHDEEQELALRRKEAEASYYQGKRAQSGFYHDRSGTHVDFPNGTTHQEPAIALASSEHQCNLGFEDKHERARQHVLDTCITTLTGLLRKIYKAGSNRKLSLFTLSPESGHRSGDPIQPFAIIQREDEISSDLRDSRNLITSFKPVNDLIPVYRWLRSTLAWSPVFDWDWFMVPDEISQRVDRAYHDMFMQGIDISRIVEQFKQLREADVPVHLLIGKRDFSESSCYWGWPYNSQKWEKWLHDDFDSTLSDIASLVDSLSIFYDLRNPLSEQRLEQIEALEPNWASHSRCPRTVCPWTLDEESFISSHCPFRLHGQPHRRSRTEKRNGGQEMANKRAIKTARTHVPTDYANLANYSLSAPPVGENASDHPSDDSDDDSKPSSRDRPLHQLARKAAFAREAVGWQRFWAQYSLKFIRLKVLRIRMPHSFDIIASWRLAKLLSRNLGWQMFIFTDERQHVQTTEDVKSILQTDSGPRFEHDVENKIWPGGRFVRRSWIWPQTKFVWLNDPYGSRPLSSLEVQTPSNWADQDFSTADWNETEAHEEEEFRKAAKRAGLATQEEQKAVNDEIRQNDRRVADRVRRRRDGLLVSALQKYGTYEWKRGLHKRIHVLETHIAELGQKAEKHKGEDNLVEDCQVRQQVWNRMIEMLRRRSNETPPFFGPSRLSPGSFIRDDKQLKGALGYGGWDNGVPVWYQGESPNKDWTREQTLNAIISGKLIESSLSRRLEDHGTNRSEEGSQNKESHQIKKTTTIIQSTTPVSEVTMTEPAPILVPDNSGQTPILIASDEDEGPISLGSEVTKQKSLPFAADIIIPVVPKPSLGPVVSTSILGLTQITESSEEKQDISAHDDKRKWSQSPAAEDEKIRSTSSTKRPRTLPSIKMPKEIFKSPPPVLLKTKINSPELSVGEPNYISKERPMPTPAKKKAKITEEPVPFAPIEQPSPPILPSQSPETVRKRKWPYPKPECTIDEPKTKPVKPYRKTRGSKEAKVTEEATYPSLPAPPTVSSLSEDNVAEPRNSTSLSSSTSEDEGSKKKVSKSKRLSRSAFNPESSSEDEEIATKRGTKRGRGRGGRARGVRGASGGRGGARGGKKKKIEAGDSDVEQGERGIVEASTTKRSAARGGKTAIATKETAPVPRVVVSSPARRTRKQVREAAIRGGGCRSV